MNFSPYKLLYKAGSCLRRTPVLNYLEGLKESQWWSLDRYREYQLLKLRELLSHARRHSEFYRKHFDENGFEPDLGSIEDLQDLPPLDRGSVLSNAASIQNSGPGGRMIYTETSGSSGVPLSFYRTPDWDAQHRAAVLRGLSWYGTDPWMPSGLLWGIPSSRHGRIKTRFEDFLQNRFRETRFDLSEGTLEAFYRKLKRASFLEGYSSMIYELARHINRYHPGGGGLSLRIVKGTSERIYPHYQEEAVRAFGKRITGEYGAAETGIIAFECPEGRLHVNMEHVIVEIVEGEIVVTNLLSHSFPFIRYRLGDYVRLEDGFTCKCGRQGLVIEDIEGRVGRRIYATDGSSFPSLTVYYILKSVYARGSLLVRCQAVQREMGRLDFLVVPRPGQTPRERADLERIFEDLVHHYYGDKIDYSLELVDEIREAGGKQVDFISKVDIGN